MRLILAITAFAATVAACSPAELGRYSLAVMPMPTLPADCAERLAREGCAVTVPPESRDAFAAVRPNTPITRMMR